MMRPGTTKIILSLTALFLLGGVCGYAFSNRQTERPAAKAHWEERWMELRQREDQCVVWRVIKTLSVSPATYREPQVPGVDTAAAAGPEMAVDGLGVIWCECPADEIDPDIVGDVLHRCLR